MINFYTPIKSYGYLLILILLGWGCQTSSREVFEINWDEQVNQVWVGENLWANRLQDWRVENHRVACVGGAYPMRTLHLLTHEIVAYRGSIDLSVQGGLITKNTQLDRADYIGMLLGAGDIEADYRTRSLVHQCGGTDGGIIAGINGAGFLFVYDNQDTIYLAMSQAPVVEAQSWQKETGIKLNVSVNPQGSNYEIAIWTGMSKGELSDTLFHTIAEADVDKLTGNLALIVNGGQDSAGHSFWMDNWQVEGDKLQDAPERKLGPIIAAQHTLSKSTLTLTGQLMPIAVEPATTVRLQTKPMKGGDWEDRGISRPDLPSYTIHFDITDWDDTQDHLYRLLLFSQETDYTWEGTIRRDPIDKSEIVVAGFTGNNHSLGTIEGYYDFNRNRIWFPHEDLVGAVRLHDPDLLFFSGDQIYEGRPTPADLSGEPSSYLDYLYKWYIWCWAYRDLLRDIPTVTIPDDHDVYHGNIWGAEGKKAPQTPANGVYPPRYEGRTHHWSQDMGGYKMSADFVRMVEKTQTSHLPAPYDPTPVQQDIGVYYTDLLYGGISFAILEDRKFKSPPSVILPAAQVVNGFSQVPDYDSRLLDVPSAVLLGERQLNFIEDWTMDWEGTWMKVALSQTIFANVSTYPDSFTTDAGTPQLKPLPQGVIPKAYRLAQDMDSNGWPQSGRNRALEALRKGFAFMYAGDQHLGSLVHHGVDDWGDAGWSFCVPSVANLWPRRWFPPEPGENHQSDMPRYTGDYLDGFGNRITVWAASNPYLSGYEPRTLHDRAPGYGIIRLNKRAQTITAECWPRYITNPLSSRANQYPGWPKTLKVMDNYGRKAAAFLPRLEVKGLATPPVIQIINEAGEEHVYSIRLGAMSHRPKVFEPGLYTVHIGEPGTTQMETFIHIPAQADTTGIEPIAVSFE